MVACKTEGCDKEVGRHGRKGFCQKCYRSSSGTAQSTAPPTLTDDSAMQLFSSPPVSLNQSVVIPDIQMVNASFKTDSTDYVTIPDTPSQSMDEMFAMIVQMKEEYNHQLKKRDEAIASLSLCVAELQDELKSHHKTQQLDGGESEPAIPETPSEEVKELKETVELQSKTVHQQQVFLEHLANKDRANNLIITGIPEGDNDEDSVSDVITAILPREDIKVNQHFQIKRIGDDQTARKPRPLLLQFNKDVPEKRKKLLQNNKKLKDVENYDRVYIKPDQHPIFRKEHNRLRSVAYNERKKAENQGCNIVYKAKEGVVTKDDIVIDRFSIHFQ